MKKTNFDKYLDEQMKDPEFAARFEAALAPEVSNLAIFNRKIAILLNILIIAVYLMIGLIAPSRLMMLAGFLVFAIIIRAATMVWMGMSFEEAAQVSRSDIYKTAASTILLGLVFSLGLFGLLYLLDIFWASGASIVIPTVSFLVAYLSTFPVFFGKN